MEALRPPCAACEEPGRSEEAFCDPATEASALTMPLRLGPRFENGLRVDGWVADQRWSPVQVLSPN